MLKKTKLKCEYCKRQLYYSKLSNKYYCELCNNYFKIEDVKQNYYNLIKLLA